MSAQASAPLTSFQIIDEADCEQIANFDTGVKQALAYMHKGRKEVSYTGVQLLTQRAADKGHAMSVDMIKYEILKHDPEDITQWYWHSIVKARNQQTGLETLGVSSRAYSEVVEVVTNQGQPNEIKEKVLRRDPFSDTTAMSKAERNALRKQIPADVLQRFLDSIDEADLKVLGWSKGNADKNNIKPTRSPSEKQINYLKGTLKWTGTIPATMDITSALIKDIIARKIEAVMKDPIWAKYLQKKTDNANNNNDTEKSKGPTDEQLKQLEDLDYQGTKPFSVDGADALIKKLKAVMESNKMCWCVTPNPSNDTVPAGPNAGCYVCTRCSCLIKELMPEAAQK